MSATKTRTKKPKAKAAAVRHHESSDRSTRGSVPSSLEAVQGIVGKLQGMSDKANAEASWRQQMVFFSRTANADDPDIYLKALRMLGDHRLKRSFNPDVAVFVGYFDAEDFINDGGDPKLWELEWEVVYAKRDDGLADDEYWPDDATPDAVRENWREQDRRRRGIIRRCMVKRGLSEAEADDAIRTYFGTSGQTRDHFKSLLDRVHKEVTDTRS